MSSDVLIPIDPTIQGRLDAIKEPQEDYNAVLIRLLAAYEFNTLSDEDRQDIEQSIREIQEDRYCTIEELMDEEGLF